MKTLVMKFGGAALSNCTCFPLIAEIIAAQQSIYDRVAVVVSAMGDTTDQLIDLAKQVHPDPPRREYDMLLTVGERISIALLAMALQLKNREAFSFTGSQSGIITCHRHADARVIEVRPHRILPYLEEGKVAIVAGFQGVSQQGMITTLGRGGGDISAVALAIALGAETVEFYKDVPGIYAHDPRHIPQAQCIEEMDYEMALQIAKGGGVLHPRSIELARKNAMPLHVRPFDKDQASRSTGTFIRDHKLPKPSKLQYEEV